MSDIQPTVETPEVPASIPAEQPAGPSRLRQAAEKNQLAAAQTQPTAQEKSKFDDAARASLLQKYGGNHDKALEALWKQNSEVRKILEENKRLKAQSVAAPATDPSAAPPSPSPQPVPATAASTPPGSEPSETATEPEPKAITPKQLANEMFYDLLLTGQPSEDTLARFREAGFTDSEISLEKELRQSVVDRRFNDAQAAVNSPIKDVWSWFISEGAAQFTDSQLRIIEAGLSEEMYDVLKPVEAKYLAAKGKPNVPHASTNRATATASAGSKGPYASAAEYYADVKAGAPADVVNERFARSDTSGWAEELQMQSVFGTRR